MMLRVLAAAALAMGLMAGAASAATLENVKGAVSVDRGDGFAPVSGGTVKTGDTVKVAIGGSASINYGGGVVIPVRSGQTIKVSDVYGVNGGGSTAQWQRDYLYWSVGTSAFLGIPFLLDDNGKGNRVVVVPSP